MESKKRILLIAANDLGNSGVPGVIMSIVRNLSDKYIFDIVITRENYYHRNEFLSFGGKIFLIKEREYKNKIKRIWWRLLGKGNYIKKEISKIFKINEYNAIHSFKEGDSYLYLSQAKKYGIKIRIIHNNRQKESNNSPFINYFLNQTIRKSIKLSTYNISVSKECGLTFFGNKPFKVIYNCINENKFSYTEFTGNVDDLSFLQVGTFLPIKNQIFSLGVIALLKQKYANVHCYFIGKVFDESYYRLFKAKIEEYGLKNNVSVLDSATDQKKLIGSISYSLLPSLNEGLSLTAIESQVCGLMVFASTRVPKEVDLGNITFLELDTKNWAVEIGKYFEENKKLRKPVDSSLFSVNNFKQKIDSVYNMVLI